MHNFKGMHKFITTMICASNRIVSSAINDEFDER